MPERSANFQMLVEPFNKERNTTHDAKLSSELRLWLPSPKDC
jgi:hypothetical protein